MMEHCAISANATRFRQDGVLFPIRVLPDEEIAEFLARLLAIEAARAGRLPPALNAKPHLLLPWLWDLVHDPRVVDPVANLLGDDLLCWGTSFVAKQPGDGRYVSWHQDATHWKLSAFEAVTAWIAFTPSVPENGCVRVLPGSHKVPLPHVDNADRKNLLGRREQVVEAVAEDTAIDIDLAPGEMSLHDVLVVHGSRPNTSRQRRIGFAVRYIPSHLRQIGGLRNSATLVRGRDFGHFDLESAPRAEFDRDALAQHAAAVRKGMRVIFSDPADPPFSEDMPAPDAADGGVRKGTQNRSPT